MRLNLGKNIIAAALCGLLLAFFTAIAWTAWLDKCATNDEPLHFASAWIQTHDGDFRCDPEDPPLWKYLAVLGTDRKALKVDQNFADWKLMLTSMLGEGIFFRDFLFFTPGNDFDAAIRGGRARMLVVGILLGITIVWWAWRLRGPVAGVAAAALFCFDPNFLAHSPLVKNDVSITLVFLLLMAALWLLGERATGPRWAAVSILFGAALTVKFSGLLAIPMLGIALLCRVLIAKPWPMFKWMAQTRLQRLAAAGVMAIGALLVAYVVIWASYGFRFGPSRDSTQLFDLSDVLKICREREYFATVGGPLVVRTAEMDQWGVHWHPPIPVRLAQWADRHRLLPQTWLVGFLFTYGTTRVRAAFLCGHTSMLGWWYYFPLVIAFKTPLATLGGLLLAAVFWFWRRGFMTSRNWWPLCAAAIAPVLYMAAAMRSHIDIGMRHILPVYPFLFIFMGVAAAEAWQWRPRLARWIAGILLVGLVAETCWAYPNFIPFFNIAAGGSRGGIRLLGDSNIDWGQELPALAAWQREHPDRQLYLYYFGSVDPRSYGIHYMPLSHKHRAARPGQTPQPAVGICLRATAFQDPFLPEDQKEFYNAFLSRRPIAVLGGSLYLFDGR